MSHPDTSWRDDALCAQVDPEVFFPDKARGETARNARRICARCPVTDWCLDYALTHPDTRGVWGGTTERDRRNLRRNAA